MKELIEIQSELKVQKKNYNAFGKYYYRNAEDILEAVKPLLKEMSCHLLLSDEMIGINDRNYVKSTATLVNSKGESISVTASAREAVTKKGMDDSQITGATSSYSRKYAMNGLFAIDDTKDADTTNTHGKTTEEPKEKATPKQKATQEIVDKIKQLNKDGKRDDAVALYNKYTFTEKQIGDIKNG